MPKPSTKSSAKKTKISNSVCTAVLKIVNEEGLHTRPAAAFVRVAQKYNATITVRLGKLKANGKSILSLLALGAKKGSRILLRAKGERADEALQALRQLIRTGFQ